MVIVAGAAEKGVAAEHLKHFQADGPAGGGFPQLIDSATVEGLKPGFHVVVAGIPASEAVARQMADALKLQWEGTYIREVRVETVETVTCDTDPRCVRAVPSMQVLGLRVGDDTSMNGSRLSIGGDPTGPDAQWTQKETLTALAGQPTLFEVYAGGGEGDCQTSMLQFSVDGTPTARLFFDSYCFGDTSEDSRAPEARDAESFALVRTETWTEDAELGEDGQFSGTPKEQTTTQVYQWKDGTLTRIRG